MKVQSTFIYLADKTEHVPLFWGTLCKAINDLPLYRAHHLTYLLQSVLCTFIMLKYKLCSFLIEANLCFADLRQNLYVKLRST